MTFIQILYKIDYSNGNYFWILYSFILGVDLYLVSQVPIQTTSNYIVIIYKVKWVNTIQFPFIEY